MKHWLEIAENVVDRIIPYLLVLLIYVIIVDLFYKEAAAKYSLQLAAVDYFVVAVFVIDLAFKYNRVRKVPQFLKKYWLDIMAIFPFFLFFRLIEESLVLSETIASRLQKLFHTGILIEEETGIFAGEAETIAKEVTRLERFAEAGRARLLTRIIRPIQRLPRFLKAFDYYEKPHIKRKK